jgi:signal transduction histidine kinase
MQTIRARLSANYLIVLTIGMTIAAALMWLVVSSLYINTQRENLLAQAKLIAAGLQDSTLPTLPVEPYSQALNVSPGIHTRLIGESGAVIVGLPLSDGMIQLPVADQAASIPPRELIQRPEIKAALKGTPATALRRMIESQRILYAAAPIQSSSGQITGIVYIATPLPEAGLPINMILQLLSAIAIAFLLAVVTGGMLARKISTPLEGLAEAAIAVSKGDLSQTVSTNTKISELHNVSRIFNEMIENLHQSDETKKAFIADVTHELRTPLTVIKGTIETLEDGALDDIEGRSSLLSSMMHETDRLIRMVNDLLVLTRADAGSLPLNIQELDLIELAKMRCETLSLMASSRHVELKMISASRPLLAHVDPDRISQVLNNLLDNAIRHSPPHSVVTVAINLEDDGVECSVSDSGIGIPAKHLPFIFDRFYRVEASRDRVSGGTGLGLAIARALVTAHGGKISVSSIEGEGTTIMFWLPRTSTYPNVDND